MRISNNISISQNNSGKPYFKAVIMSPVPEKWDQRVLKSVLNSKTILDIVKTNEKLGKDSQLRYYKSTGPRYPESPASDDVYLNVSGEVGKVSLSSHSTYKFIPGSFFENRPERVVIHGPKDIGLDLANQIDAIDHRQPNDPAPNTMDYLKKIASKILYEPEVPVEPY